MRNVLSILFLFIASSALAAKEGGTVYICANPDNSIKLTVDASEKSFNNVAVVMIDGVSKLFHEYHGKTRANLFLFGAVKHSTLQIKKDANSPALISLNTDPETNHSQVAHSGEGVSITKFDATLSVPSLPIENEAVSCLETKWTEQ